MTFSSPVATAEFSKLAGILSAALSQHHLLGFEIAQLDIGKDSDAGRDWGQEENGTAEDEMAGWHH